MDFTIQGFNQRKNELKYQDLSKKINIKNKIMKERRIEIPEHYRTLVQYLKELPNEEKAIMYERALNDKVNIIKFFTENQKTILNIFGKVLPLPTLSEIDGKKEELNSGYEVFKIYKSNLEETNLAIRALFPFIKNERIA